jgi:protein-S-isoprenylcysteine O-methyltransferase Ste14
MVVFRKYQTGIAPWDPATALVTEGPYRRTRNPMYLGMAALYGGIALGFGLLWALALLPVVILLIDRVVIRREEAYLETKYGDAYRDYRNRVRRWI